MKVTTQAPTFEVGEKKPFQQEMLERAGSIEPLQKNPRQRCVNRVHALRANDFETMLLDQALQTRNRVPLKICWIQVFGLHERNAKVKNASGLADSIEFRQDLFGVFHMLQDRIADNGIKEIRGDRNLMQRGVDVDVGIVEAGRDVLVIQPAFNEMPNVPVACPGVEHVTFEIILIRLQLDFNRRKNFRDS